MAFKRITENDMLGKGNVGKPDTPGVSTSEMQRIMDELPREVIAPAFNELSGQLEANTASADIGANAPDGITPDPAPAENSPAKLQSVLQGIVNKITDHIADQVKHVTSEERTLWNNASNDRHTHDNKSILDGITSSLVGNWNAAFAHVSDAVRHITENERTNWNDKYTKSETDKAINERVVEIGSSDMTKAVYDPETRNLPYIPKIDAEALTLGKNVVLSGAPVSIAYAGAQRIAAITAYGETPQGGTTEAPVALTGISSVTVNDDVTELPIPRPLRRVGDVKDKCITRQKYESAEKLVVTYNVGFVELDGTETSHLYAGIFYLDYSAAWPTPANRVNGVCSHYPYGAYSKGKIGLTDNGAAVVYNPNGDYTGDEGGLANWKAYLAAQKAAGTPVQVAYHLATPETYATDPVDFDNSAGPLTVMTGGELEVRMTELVGNREFTERLSYIGNPNLLDNSNFTNPVNQRDGTSYSASTGNAAYAIDRWRIEGATYTVATHTLSGTSYTNRACRMAQFIEMVQYGLNIGDDMTFSIMANGTKHSATAKILDRDQYSSFENVPSAYSCDDFDIVLCTGLSKPSILSFTICPKKALVLEWAKLEKGSVATPYVHKSYGAELSACQRYFYYLDATKWYACYQITGWGLIIPIDLPVPMRAQPTANTVGEVKVFTPSGWVNATSVSTNQFNRDKARINIVLTMPSGSMDSYEGRAMVATGIESLSADL